MREDCQSGAAPCDHIERTQTLCPTCRKSVDGYNARFLEREIEKAARLLRDNGYVVAKPVHHERAPFVIADT